jgi:Z1 domain
MLVNVSRFNSVQGQVRNLIDVQLSDMQVGIEAWAKSTWRNSNVLQQLKRVWDQEYSHTAEFDWDSIRAYLNASVSSIKSHLVNMRGSGIDKNVERDTRNIDSLRKLGWRVAVVWECSMRLGPFKEVAERVGEWLQETNSTLTLPRRRKTSAAKRD